MKRRYNIEETPSFQDASGATVRVFRVWSGEGEMAKYNGADVWWDGKLARCTRCSGMLSAMLSTCPHARAVKRHYGDGER